MGEKKVKEPKRKHYPEDSSYQEDSRRYQQGLPLLGPPPSAVEPVLLDGEQVFWRRELKRDHLGKKW